VERKKLSPEDFLFLINHQKGEDKMALISQQNITQALVVAVGFALGQMLTGFLNKSTNA